MMTTEFFSVDRRGLYKIGDTLTLFKQNPLSSTFLAVEDFIAPGELAAHLSVLFPDGLSLRGWDYMTRHLDFLTKAGTSTCYASYDATLELVLEYVRRAAFRHHPSRLQSYFAFASLDDAKAFRVGTQPIYRLHANAAVAA
jgi:hypothetical protein